MNRCTTYSRKASASFMAREQPHISLSLVVPVWNTPIPFLDECLSPFQGSIRDERVELIIVDDGSNPDVASYLDSLTFTVPAVIIHQGNRGQSIARQTGIRKAHGDYIGFLDSDDYISVDALRDILNVVVGNDADIIAFRGERVDACGRRVIGEVGWKNGPSLKREYVRNCAELWMQFIRRRFYLEQSEPFAYEGICVGEDLATIVPLVIRANSIEYVDINLYRYRQQEGSVLHSMDFEHRLSVLDAFDHILDELTDSELNAYHNEIEWQAINHLLNYETRVQLKDGFLGLRRARALGSWVDKHFVHWRGNPFIKQELKRQGVALRLSIRRRLRTIMLYQRVMILLKRGGHGN